MGMTTRISRGVLDRILALAGAETTEICGLLLGEGDYVSAILPAGNVAQDPAAHFEIDPAQLIAAHKAVRAGGPAILGHYHSHPGGRPEPSVTDAACAAADGALWLIAGRERDVRLWRAGASGLHGRFSEVPFVVEP